MPNEQFTLQDIYEQNSELVALALEKASKENGLFLNGVLRPGPRLKTITSFTPATEIRALMMALYAESKGSPTYGYLTFATMQKNNIRYNKEGGYLAAVYDNWTKYVNRTDPRDIISKEDFMRLSAEAKKKYQHQQSISNLYNIDVTDFSRKLPDQYKEVTERGSDDIKGDQIRQNIYRSEVDVILSKSSILSSATTDDERNIQLMLIKELVSAELMLRHGRSSHIAKEHVPHLAAMVTWCRENPRKYRSLEKRIENVYRELRGAELKRIEAEIEERLMLEKKRRDETRRAEEAQAKKKEEEKKSTKSDKVATAVILTAAEIMVIKDIMSYGGMKISNDMFPGSDEEQRAEAKRAFMEKLPELERYETGLNEMLRQAQVVQKKPENIHAAYAIARNEGKRIYLYLQKALDSLPKGKDDRMMSSLICANVLKESDKQPRNFTVVTDQKNGIADVILPTGVHWGGTIPVLKDKQYFLSPDEIISSEKRKALGIRTKSANATGFNKEKISEQLKLTGIRHVRFFLPYGLHSYNPTDEYLREKNIYTGRIVEGQLALTPKGFTKPVAASEKTCDYGNKSATVEARSETGVELRGSKEIKTSIAEAGQKQTNSEEKLPSEKTQSRKSQFPINPVELDESSKNKWTLISLHRDINGFDYGLSMKDLGNGHYRAYNSDAVKIQRYMGKPIELETSVLGNVPYVEITSDELHKAFQDLAEKETTVLIYKGDYGEQGLELYGKVESDELIGLNRETYKVDYEPEDIIQSLVEDQEGLDYESEIMMKSAERQGGHADSSLVYIFSEGYFGPGSAPKVFATDLAMMYKEFDIRLEKDRQGKLVGVLDSRKMSEYITVMSEKHGNVVVFTADNSRGMNLYGKDYTAKNVHVDKEGAYLVEITRLQPGKDIPSAGLNQRDAGYLSELYATVDVKLDKDTLKKVISPKGIDTGDIDEHTSHALMKDYGEEIVFYRKFTKDEIYEHLLKSPTLSSDDISPAIEDIYFEARTERNLRASLEEALEITSQYKEKHPNYMIYVNMLDTGRAYIVGDDAVKTAEQLGYTLQQYRHPEKGRIKYIEASSWELSAITIQQAKHNKGIFIVDTSLELPQPHISRGIK